VVTKRPKVEGSEKWGVKCSEVKWREMKIVDKMCVLPLIYSYVAVCMFCAVRCVSIICCYLLSSNYSTYIF